MRKNMIPIPPELALDRVLASLEKELVGATDEEIEQAAQELGMNLRMKGSAAFAGVLAPMPKRIEDIFDLEELRRVYGRFMGQRSLPPKDGSEGDDD